MATMGCDGKPHAKQRTRWEQHMAELPPPNNTTGKQVCNTETETLKIPPQPCKHETNFAYNTCV